MTYKALRECLIVSVFVLLVTAPAPPIFSQTPVRVGTDRELLEKHPMYNERALQFSATTLDGKTFDMKDYQDHVIVLHCWSLTCALCFRELPELNLIVEEFKNRKVLVVSLMDDSVAALWERIISDTGFYKLKEPIFGNSQINFQIIPNAKELMLEYKSNDIPFGFPTTYVIKNGILKNMVFGYKMSHGNPTPESSKNYSYLRRMINEVLENE